MDQDFSFPICVHLAPPSPSRHFSQKSRAKSMSTEDAPIRKPFHAHRRSAAVSEDLRGSANPFRARGSPTPDAEADVDVDIKPQEVRKVAFAPQTPLLDSPKSVSRSPFMSPRRRTYSTAAEDETPCIDLDEALYSKTLHRRTESLPVCGLNSPFAPPRPVIEPVLEEEERVGDASGELPNSNRNASRGASRAASPSSSVRINQHAIERPSKESLSSSSSVESEKKSKRWSFFRSPTRSTSPRASPRLLSPRKLRDIPSVSSLGIPESLLPPVRTNSPAPDPSVDRKRRSLAAWVFRK